MEDKSYTTIDRAALGWPSGPWDGEPDKAQWVDKATGLPCLAVRNGQMGHWCGYVGVPRGHWLYGKSADAALSVHGGINFADRCRPHDGEAVGICHIPGPGESDDVWWVGFDCAHGYDLVPGMAAFAQKHPDAPASVLWGTYRTLEFVKAQCAELAAQLV